MPSQSNVTEGKKTASRLLAREITLTPGLLDALRPTGNPERELSTAEKNQLKRRTAPPRHHRHSRHRQLRLPQWSLETARVQELAETLPEIIGINSYLEGMQ